MIQLTSSWLEKRFTDNDWRSLLKELVLKNNVGRGEKRPNNATKFVNTEVGDLIDSLKVRDFIKALNTEINVRNDFFKNNKEVPQKSNISTSSIIINNLILAQHYTSAQNLLSFMLGDDILNFSSSIPNLFALVKQNQRTLVLSYETYFARLEFTASGVANTGDGVRLTYSQVQSWFDQGRAPHPYDYDNLTNILKQAGTGKVIVGIADTTNKDITWYNNITLKASTLTFTRANNTANANKTVQKQTISGYLDFTIDQEFENYMAEKLQGAIITADRFNKFKQFLNRAEVACLCDCNYCTCDCNYCTCDCNYCTCNCNYCTCDCNYCTCDCNYCTCNTNKEYSTLINWNYGTICNCNLNKTGKVYSVEYGIYVAAACAANAEWAGYCSCNVNKKLAGYDAYGYAIYACPANIDFTKSSLPKNSTVTTACACNVDKQWTYLITGQAIWDKRSTGQIDNKVDDNSGKTAQASVKSVCTCHINVTLYNSCPSNKNYQYKDASCPSNTNVNWASNNYVCFCNINVQVAIKCQTNSEYKTVTDYTFFKDAKEHPEYKG